MTNTNDARKAHELLDELDARAELSQEQEKLLRSFLPDRPKDATLEDLLTRVHAAWLRANPSDWGFDTPAEHHDWLFDLRNDLIRIIEEQDAPTAPVLPAGMRLAEHEDYGRVVVSPDTGYGSRTVFALDSDVGSGVCSGIVDPDSLTFIDAKPAHPEFLEIEEDYENAPAGTIVARDSINPWVKEESVWVQGSAADAAVYTVPYLKGPRRVLRWGNK